MRLIKDRWDHDGKKNKAGRKVVVKIVIERLDKYVK